MTVLMSVWLFSLASNPLPKAGDNNPHSLEQILNRVSYKRTGN
jgi:hypothetical protein